MTCLIAHDFRFVDAVKGFAMQIMRIVDEQGDLLLSLFN
jgi:hypothetical protein